MMPLADMAVTVLTTADGREKTAISREFASAWRDARAAGLPCEIGQLAPPDKPSRPEQPA